MTHANDIYDTIMRELNNIEVCDNNGSTEKQESLSLQQETDEDDIPASLLSYFESSKSRAAVCEKLILDEPEDFFASHCTEDTRKVNEQIVGNPEIFENNTSSDNHLLHAPAEADETLTQDVPVWPNNEGEAVEDEYAETEDQPMFEVKLQEEESLRNREYEAEQEKLFREEAKKEEHRRQTEDDFQKELKRIMEAEKLHQRELELMQKRAQEKLEEELQLQQEVISKMQKRVEEERRRMEEEQRRLKEEEEERMREEAERRQAKEAEKKRRDEERKKEEMKMIREEEERKRRLEKQEEERKRRLQEEEERKRRLQEEERMREETERKKAEEAERRRKDEKRKREEMKLKKEEEERKRRLKEEEDERKGEEERMREEAERKRMEEAEKQRKDEERKIKEMKLKIEKERERAEEEKMRMEREEKKRLEDEMRLMKKKEERRKKKEEEKRDDERKKIDEVRRMERERRKKEQEMMQEERERGKSKGENLRSEEERRERLEEEQKKKITQRKEERGREEGKCELDLQTRLEDEMEEKKRQKREGETIIQEKINKDEEKRGENGIQEEEEETEDMRGKEMEEKKDGREEQRSVREDERREKDEERKTDEEEGTDKEDDKKSEDGKRLLEERDEFKECDGDQRKEEDKKDGERKLEEKEEESENQIQVNKETGEETRLVGENELQKEMMENECESHKGQTETSSDPGPSRTSSVPVISTETTLHDPDTKTSSLPIFLPEHTEQKRLSWMKECISWSKLSLQNRRKQKASHQEGRGVKKVREVSEPPPLCADLLLQSTGWKSLTEVTTVTLEDLPGCSLSSLSQCFLLQSLTLTRCGLRSLEGINQLPELSYIDVQENEISFINCENLKSLRVLKLSHNKLTSIHGLSGAENLEVLELSHNSITRISERSGLESTKRLQKLCLDHNQLISTKGLRDVYTLLHLDCSHNHLLRVEGVESCGLLSTLDLRANSLTEPPALNNQVLLRELRLDDNSISSLQSLSDSWLPLLQHLSVAQNRITQLPSLSDAVSLSDLDLRFNCLSELQNVSESLEGCLFLRELHLSGNPLQQESCWRSTLQRALPSLRAIDDQGSGSSLSPPAVQQVSLPSGSFLALCQAQLQQTHDLQQRHSRELSEASSPLDAVKISCRHFSEALQLAVDQRFAHEFGDTSVTDKHAAADQTKDRKTHEVDRTEAEERTEDLEIEITGKAAPVIPNRDDTGRNNWTSEEKSTGESRHDAHYSGGTGLKRELTASKANSSNKQDSTIRQKAAVVIQQLWRKHKQKCGKITGGGGGDGEPESGPAIINRRAVGKDYAATVIQAIWRGFTLRRRLASALAAVTCSDTGEDDTFEEVDMDEFVFDEAALEKDWTLLCEDPPSRCLSVSEQQPTLKLPEASQYVLPSQHTWRSKQAWVDQEQEDSGGQRVSPVSSVRSKLPPSTPVPNCLIEKSEKILEEWGFTHSHTALMMLKRAQKMKSKKQQPKKRLDPSARQSLFRNCTYQMEPVGAQKKRVIQNRNDVKGSEVELERVKQDRAQLWLHAQAALSDRDSESVRFLPELSAGILSGGRVQLMADPGYSERQHHGSGSWANSSLAARLCRENSSTHSNSSGRARKEVPAPKQDSSAPSKKERISFRDNRVQLSGGWGGGKKRDRVLK